MAFYPSCFWTQEHRSRLSSDNEFKPSGGCVCAKDEKGAIEGHALATCSWFFFFFLGWRNHCTAFVVSWSETVEFTKELSFLAIGLDHRPWDDEDMSYSVLKEWVETHFLTRACIGFSNQLFVKGHVSFFPTADCIRLFCCLFFRFLLFKSWIDNDDSWTCFLFDGIYRLFTVRDLKTVHFISHPLRIKWQPLMISACFFFGECL